MESDKLLVCIRTRQMVDLRTCFPSLTERALMQMVHAPAQRAVYILQHSFGGNLEDAKAAWNDYVLRYVDGQTEACGPAHQQPSLSPALLH